MASLRNLCTKGKPIQIFLIIVISLLIPISSAHFHYRALSEADFLFTRLGVEAPDQISLPPGSLGKLKVLGSSDYYYLFILDNNISEQLPIISFQISPLALTVFILRC